MVQYRQSEYLFCYRAGFVTIRRCKMDDSYVEQLTIETVVFRVPQAYAALVVYFADHWGRNNADASVWTSNPTTYPNVPVPDKLVATVPARMRMVNGQKRYVSVFPHLEPETYIVIAAFPRAPEGNKSK